MGNLLSHVQFLDFSEALGFQVEEIVCSLDNYTTVIASGGSISIADGILSVKGAASGGVWTELERYIPYCRVDLDWDKKNILETNVSILRRASPVQEIGIKRGVVGGINQGFGWHTKNDGIYGHAGDGAAASELKLIDLGPGAWNWEGILKATLIPGNRVEFYVWGAYIGQITTNLPTGLDGSLCIFSIQIGPGGVTGHEVHCSGFRMYQGQ